MYLITWEDDEGMWVDDPEGFETEAEARAQAAKFPARLGACVAIYRCTMIDAIDGIGT